MALVPCKECEKEISSQAVSCPGCGAPVNAAPAAKPEQITNGRAVGLLVGIIVLFFVAFAAAAKFESPPTGIVVFVIGIALLLWMTTQSDDN